MSLGSVEIGLVIVESAEPVQEEIRGGGDQPVPISLWYSH